MEQRTRESDRPVVLLVDDDEVLCKAVGRALESVGFRVLKPTDYCDALGQIMSTPVAVVIADLNMTDRSGVDLLVDVGRFQPDAARLLMSGEEPSRLAQARARREFDAYLRKPFTIGELVGALHGVGVPRPLPVLTKSPPE